MTPCFRTPLDHLDGCIGLWVNACKLPCSSRTFAPPAWAARGSLRLRILHIPRCTIKVHTRPCWTTNRKLCNSLSGTPLLLECFQVELRGGRSVTILEETNNVTEDAIISGRAVGLPMTGYGTPDVLGKRTEFRLTSTTTVNRITTVPKHVPCYPHHGALQAFVLCQEQFQGERG